jgi:Protein of unknown function (DUF2586)
MLPGVKIIFEGGAIGGVAPSEDRILGLITTAATASPLVMGTAYVLYKYEDLATKTGINATNNAALDATIQDIYNVAGTGTELWLQCHAQTNDSEALAGKIDDFMLKTGYRPKTLGIYHNAASGYAPTVTTGLDAKIWSGKTIAQTKAVALAANKYATVLVLFQGINANWTISETDLVDLTTGSENRVGIVIGNCKNGTNVWGAIGLVLGKIGANTVGTHIGRVKDGKLPVEKMYLTPNLLIENEVVNNAVISDKGYITFRAFVGKAGYFITDDKLATGVTDDFKFITRRRTIDKAYRLAYQRIVEEVNETVPINADGTIQAAWAKALQGNIESHVAINMIGDVSVDTTDPNDKGVKCFINVNQNIVTTEQLNIVLKVRPFGYSKYINVSLGFMIGK